MPGLNTYADFAADICLDLGRDWAGKDEVAMQEAKLAGASFRLCSEGALHKGGNAAAGIAFVLLH